MEIRKFLFVTLLFSMFSVAVAQEKQPLVKATCIENIDLAQYNIRDYSFERSFNDQLNLENYEFLFANKQESTNKYFLVTTSKTRRTASKIAYESYENTFLSNYHFKEYVLKNPLLLDKEN